VSVGVAESGTLRGTDPLRLTAMGQRLIPPVLGFANLIEWRKK